MSKTPRLLLGGDTADPLVVVRSHFWNFNAVGLYRGDQACVIDPGIEPADIEALGTALLGNRGGGRSVTHVVLTHSHHDHIRGWMRFPGARVIMPAVVAAKAETARERILATKRKIDDHLGIHDPDFRYPQADLTFDDRLAFEVGGLDIELRFLPGHSDCICVVCIPELRTLLTADYLVSPGLPYCRWRAREFEAAIATLRSWVVEEGFERVVPAHNEPIVGREHLLEALDAERDYFLHLRAEVRAAIERGLDDEGCAREAARQAARRRGVDLGGRARQDLDNARRVLTEERS
ncbi:MAG: MBL fold metallo-hydrolase [Planctomycetota bacterium]